MIAPRSASVASWMGTMLLLLLQSANAFQEPAFVAARRGGVGRRGVMGVAGQTMRRRIGALRGICFTCSWEGGYKGSSESLSTLETAVWILSSPLLTITSAPLSFLLSTTSPHSLLLPILFPQTRHLSRHTGCRRPLTLPPPHGIQRRPGRQL